MYSLSVVHAIKITADLAYLSCLPSSVAFLPKIAQVPASPIHSSTTHWNGESCSSVSQKFDQSTVRPQCLARVRTEARMICKHFC